MKRKNKALIVTSLIFVVLALILLVVGFSLAGNDVIAWLGSKWAWIFYIVFGCYALVALYVIIGDKIKGM